MLNFNANYSTSQSTSSTCFKGKLPQAIEKAIAAAEKRGVRRMPGESYLDFAKRYQDQKQAIADEFEVIKNNAGDILMIGKPKATPIEVHEYPDQDAISTIKFLESIAEKPAQ